MIGVAAGYFAAPIASTGYVGWREPDLFASVIFYMADNFAFCLCQNEPLDQSIKTVTRSLKDFETWHAKDPSSRYLRQEVGLLETQRARLELQAHQSVQAERDIRDAQSALSAVGWRDVSQTHLLKVTAQISSEYRPHDIRREPANGLQ